MKLNILFINDIHGYLGPHPELFYNKTGEYIETVGGYTSIAGYAEKIRRENPHTLLFDGGDTLHGTKPVIDSEGELLIPILNTMKLDALVGHWDFAYGPKKLKAISENFNFPVLGCNVYQEDNSLFFQPTQIFDQGDVKIGVIGICAMIVDKVMPEKMSKGLKFTSGEEELPKYISELKQRGADIIILLSHNGFPQDIHLLKKINGIDICLSSHTHNRIYEPIIVNGARIVQCGCHGAFIGNFSLEIQNKQIQKCDFELVKVDESLPKNEEIEQIVRNALQPYQEIATNVVGKTDEILHRYDALNSKMDNLLLRAIAHETKTEIAFSNGWRYGAPIPEGNITENDLYNMAPMDPPVSTVELTGNEIKIMLEENLERTFCSDPLKQMGGYVKRVFGLQINMRIENPKGHRIQEIYFGNSHLDAEKTYKVSFITTQGVAKKYGKNRQKCEVKTIEALKNYLQKNPNFSPSKIDSFRLV